MWHARRRYVGPDLSARPDRGVRRAVDDARGTGGSCCPISDTRMIGHYNGRASPELSRRVCTADEMGDD